MRRRGNMFEIESEMKIPVKVMINGRFVDLNR